ncbi:MAG: T9SS type A sorting domain-containing protein [Ignavibacteriota bacterium]|nr:MAG: T9SS C-terminal target domain-containing protein [Chlorobiota bacterium]MBE7475639.1 T9SS type A sorting domain-containing protein [Ignavibacteriales bacterium]MBL1123050.1 T9SS C-terminal target domain-containing protein [Ignavibacteriota bacterium]MCC7094197.1 T9SS type A sorting domain-containing protein [Ignavibacteriaceae bacterium]MCE7855736.1 T9SS C-terminal target domain-containing protein [Ignavibacteria bacterium CHB3]MEB2295075.1 T9SS type A sorting domain-containing protein
MKKFVLTLFLLPSLLMAQSIFNVDFSGTFPPSGWTIDAHATNWSAVSTNNSGGTAPEARFSWSPSFVGDSRLISPIINTTGNTVVTTEFKFNLDHYGGAYTLGVATRSGGGSWNIVWSKVNPTGSIPATTEIVTINNANVGAADFQICWFFSGDSYNLNYWYIDDLKLFVPLTHDVMVKDILVDATYPPATNFTPQAILKNFGLNSETFDATCTIKLGGSQVYSQNCTPITLAAGAEQTVSFPSYVLNAANDLYEITVKTNLTGDMDPTNDSRTEYFNTYTTDREMVILEIGTGTWCVYCPGAQMGGEDLVDNGHSVAVIEHHNGDSFTNNYSNARNTYYGINGFPTAVFDGVDYFVGGSNTESMYQNYLPIYQNRKALMSAFSVDIFGTNSGLDYNILVRLNRVANIPPTWNNLVVHFVLTETDIPFSWHGQTQVDYCQRLMIPDENGTAVDLLNNSYIEIPLSFNKNSTWITEKCQLSVFIQNLNTKEILQGDKVWLTELLPVPVELTAFTAEASVDGVILRWTTATELNNHGFEIEKSADGTEFFTIAFVPGAGTTTETKNYSYTDEVGYKGGETFYYRLKQVDLDGRIQYSNIAEVVFDVPKDFVLHQNYPNPFNPSTTIKFAVPKTSLVNIKVYDLTGQEVSVLVNEVKEAGTYEIKFDARSLASGIYLYRMTAENFSSVRKLNILK